MSKMYKLPASIRGFYKAIGQRNGVKAAAHLEGVEFDYAVAEMLLPAAQAYRQVNRNKAKALVVNLFVPGLHQYFADTFHRTSTAKLGMVARLLRKSDGHAATMFRAREDILHAVRSALGTSEREESAKSEKLTVKDRKFIKALGLGGKWTRDQLLNLTLDVASYPWSTAGLSLWLYFGTMAEFCKATEDEVLSGSNRIGPLRLRAYKKDLKELGLKFGMFIGRIDEIAIGQYALYRANIKLGSEELLDMPLDILPEGLPLSPHHVDQLNLSCEQHLERSLVTVRELHELPDYDRDVLEDKEVFDPLLLAEILRRRDVTLSLLGFGGN